jgi:hypothetical protein
MMRQLARSFVPAVLLAALTLWAANPAEAQSTNSTSSSQQPAPTAQTPTPAPSANGTYVAINPLAGVRYDNKYDLFVGMAYHHMKAGPTLLQGSNLGGVDVTGTMWLKKRWGLQTSERMFWGTSGAGINHANAGGGNIKGPFVAEYFFTGGAVWLGPHNQHGAITAHFLGGGVYGSFEQSLLGQSPSVVGFYNSQFAPAAIVGGSFDLNRNAHWVFRVSPDAVMTHYGINYYPNTSQFDVNFAISVGMQYKFMRKKR